MNYFAPSLFKTNPAQISLMRVTQTPFELQITRVHPNPCHWLQPITGMERQAVRCTMSMPYIYSLEISVGFFITEHSVTVQLTGMKKGQVWIILQTHYLGQIGYRKEWQKSGNKGGILWLNLWYCRACVFEPFYCLQSFFTSNYNWIFFKKSLVASIHLAKSALLYLLF